MKGLLECVICGREAAAGRHDEGAAGGKAEEAATVNLLPARSSAVAAASSQQKRRRHRATGDGAAPQWRPTLGVISEDGALRVKAAAEERTKRTATAPAKPRAARPARNYAWERENEYRNLSSPTVFMVFATSAFLF
ncbi:unnamed protein product [Spirodela intermedia]|uniref:Uncharacterized protein n=2 Tax=Spirodela intermedia TaxID=51605 RepID=A0A7I8ILN8_SPIIN|nr:unnamed protein product [Spirodela intermedia]CAA6658336.1 unnamed protein product [Spirodela intermedia]CAA7394537.1 unnamed protein product [Spirodela intermedia]